MKNLIYLLLSILFVSCSVDDSITNNYYECPVVETPTEPTEPEPVDLMVSPDWLQGCWLSEWGSTDGTDRMVCFEKKTGFLDLTFTYPDGTLILPYQPISYDLNNPDNDFGKLENYKIFHENNIDYVKFDWYDIFYPEKKLQYTITRVITDDGSRKINIQMWDGDTTYHYSTFIFME